MLNFIAFYISISTIIGLLSACTEKLPIIGLTTSIIGLLTSVVFCLGEQSTTLKYCVAVAPGIVCIATIPYLIIITKREKAYTKPGINLDYERNFKDFLLGGAERKNKKAVKK